MIFAIIFWSAIKRSGNFTNLLNTRRFNSLKNQYLKRNFSSFKACKNFSLDVIHSVRGNYSQWSVLCTLHGCRTGPAWSCWYSGRRLTPWLWRCWRWSCWATTEREWAASASPCFRTGAWRYKAPRPSLTRPADTRKITRGASEQNMPQHQKNIHPNIAKKGSDVHDSKGV